MKLRFFLAHAALFLVSLIYAANFSLAKLAMPEYIKPLGFIVLRAVAGTTLFWISSLFVREKVPIKDLGLMALCAVFGVAINQMLFFKGLELTRPISGAMIMMTAPILVLLFAVLAKQEKLNYRKLIGIALGLGGAFILITSKTQTNVPNAPNPLLGNLFIAINASSYAIYLILVKPLIKKYHPITLLKWVFGIGLIYVFPFGIGEASQIQWHSFTPTIWGVLAFVLLGVTFLAYLLNAAALTVVKPSVVSTYIYLQPLLASFIAIGLGSDQLTLRVLSAGALIFAGVTAVSWNKRTRPEPLDASG